MIKAVCSKNNQLVAGYDCKTISEIYQDSFDIMWVDIHLERHELLKAETELLADVFKFHEMSIEDCLFSQYYPKTEEFENYIFGAIHGIQLKPNYFQEFEDSIYELNFFIKKNLVVTVHSEDLFFVETLFERAKTRPLVDLKNVAVLLFNIFNKVVSSYEFTLEKIDDKIEDLEDKIIKDPETDDMEQIIDTKKVIFAMRKIAEAQQAAYIYFTRSGSDLVSKEFLVYFRDIYTQCARINQSIAMRSQMAVTLLEIYMSSITLRLTDVMKVLTIIATVLMPTLIVSGYYGMNVRFPELAVFGEKGIWFFAIGLMLVSVIVMIIYFIKKKWF
jgi:magnesium transporter